MTKYLVTHRHHQVRRSMASFKLKSLHSSGYYHNKMVTSHLKKPDTTDTDSYSMTNSSVIKNLLLDIFFVKIRNIRATCISSWPELLALYWYIYGVFSHKGCWRKIEKQLFFDMFILSRTILLDVACRYPICPVLQTQLLIRDLASSTSPPASQEEADQIRTLSQNMTQLPLRILKETGLLRRQYLLLVVSWHCALCLLSFSVEGP